MADEGDIEAFVVDWDRGWLRSEGALSLQMREAMKRDLRALLDKTTPPRDVEASEAAYALMMGLALVVPDEAAAVLVRAASHVAPWCVLSVEFKNDYDWI